MPAFSRVIFTAVAVWPGQTYRELTTRLDSVDPKFLQEFR